jgi:hypothetical protein
VATVRTDAVDSAEGKEDDSFQLESSEDDVETSSGGPPLESDGEEESVEAPTASNTVSVVLFLSRDASSLAFAFQLYSRFLFPHTQSYRRLSRRKLPWQQCALMLLIVLKARRTTPFSWSHRKMTWRRRVEGHHSSRMGRKSR